MKNTRQVINKKKPPLPRERFSDLAFGVPSLPCCFRQCHAVLGITRSRTKNVYQRLRLTQRANQAATLPTIDVVDMRQEVENGNVSSFSMSLQEKLQERLEKNEQSVLLLNRRGYSSFVMCRDCGYVLPCPNCDISLTLHMDSKTMKCHYCGHEERIPYRCPNCGQDKIRYYGTGTQKVEEELQTLLPDSRILRMDVDTTRRKGAHEKILRTFGEGQADILLGTQMIAKGLDFPNVTLVGVLNADTALNLPDFRSSERTFQLLTQVSGRAGRAEKPGKSSFNLLTPSIMRYNWQKPKIMKIFIQKKCIFVTVGIIRRTILRSKLRLAILKKMKQRNKCFKLRRN